MTHTAVLTYVTEERRQACYETLRAYGAHRLGAEGAGTMSFLPEPPGTFVVSMDDRALGYGHQHGRSLEWL